MENAINTIDSRETGVGENMNLQEILLNGVKMSLREKIGWFEEFLQNSRRDRVNFYSRVIISPAGREVVVIDPVTMKPLKMLMFGSNNYLGLANHPYVRERVKMAVSKYGVGVGGPSLLNGYTILMKELEERLSALKGAEDTLIFSSGFCANLGLTTGLFGKGDLVMFDELSHASLCDGLKMIKTCKIPFGHNDAAALESLLEQNKHGNGREAFVCVEGVYSMDGDLAPLDKISLLCQKYGAHLVIDDAHGTGVMGRCGKGTLEHFALPLDDEIEMGTFSKAFAVTGGFISASRPVINYLRYFARTYMFSASLPPVTMAAVLAGLDVITNEPERRENLHENVRYAAARLQPYGLIGKPEAGIISLKVPAGMNIRKASARFHNAGIFLNSIEYPAVPLTSQRFRISLMSDHEKADIDKLVATVEETWTEEFER
jgi:glycine C-acetyltransferase